MVRLFEYAGYEVNVQPEALLLIPFQTIWDRDTSKGKNVAKQELAYIYFMADPRSDYQYLVDEEVRAAEIIKGLGMPEGWRPDEAVQRALTFYTSSGYLNALFLISINFCFKSSKFTSGCS